MNGKRVLVTGGAGFIGAHVVRELLALRDEIVVLDDLSGGFRDNVPKGVKFIAGSVTDHALVDRLFREHKFEHVFHLAAYAAEGLSHFIKRFNYTNNLIGSVNLINAAVNYNVECFVFTSSIAVYGSAPLPMTEETPAVPEDPYGIAKLAVEQELMCSREMFGLNYVIFRPHNVYGEYQNIGDRYRNVIGIFMNQIMKNEPLTVFGDGSQTRAFTYIKEISGVIAAAPRATHAYGEVFNVGADTPYSINELAHEVARAFRVEPRMRYLAARNEVRHAHSSHEKLRRFFACRRRYSLREGIEAMAAWAKTHGPRSSQPFEGIEIERQLPEVWSTENAVTKSA